MKGHISRTYSPMTSCYRRAQARTGLLRIVTAIALVCLAPQALSDKVRCACYGSYYNGTPAYNGRNATVVCTSDCYVFNAPTCYDGNYSPPNPVPRFCQDLSTETGVFCHPLTNIITWSGQMGTPVCFLNTNVSPQYHVLVGPDAPIRCLTVGACIDWHAVTSTNVELPDVHMDEYPTTNSVCRLGSGT